MDDKALSSPKKKMPFSMGVETDRYVYVSGQGGLDLGTGEIVGPDLEAQTVKTMENIREVLASFKLDLSDIVKVNVYLSDRSLYGEFNEIYARFFQEPYPARTLVYCELNYDLLVEIDAIAAVRNG
ncbi:RidA family protein [Paenibacillus aurantius]|uniref:RidA family protein n=1 Tax=Paenibacillus aurantius TaxID=2918900 RepID=A0AA96RH74_9BACL|nr:RidA family protein [Paenibacillus aurantius]WNQ13063.1 RidA family protein [Paenibacillus aurantius]